jgi:hypothetical protein
MIRCEFINILTFIARFNGRLPALAGYYASRRGMSDSGRILGAYINGEPCGALIADIKENASEIIYAAVNEEHRKKGVFGAMLEEFIRQSESAVRLRYAPEQPEDGLDAYLRKKGFAGRPHLITKVIPFTDAARAEWNDYLSGRSGVMLEKLNRRGFAASRFSETPREIMDKLYGEMGEKFPLFSDPRRCPNPLLEPHSFITVRSGSPAAFCAVTSADGGKTAVFEHMAASVDFIGRGAFLPCIIAAVNSLVEGGICSKLSFAYDENNSSLPEIMTGNTRFSDMSVRQMKEYVLSKSE